MKKISIVCGLIAGSLLCIFMVISSAKCYSDQNYDAGMVYGYSAMILSFSLIFVGVQNYRDKYGEGTISFGRAFKIGLYITLIASCMYVVTWLIEYYFFIPDFMDKYAAHMLKNVQEKGTTGNALKEEISSINSMKEMYQNPLMVVLMTFGEVLPVGLLVALISALILKKRPGKQTMAMSG